MFGKGPPPEHMQAADLFFAFVFFVVTHFTPKRLRAYTGWGVGVEPKS